MILLNSDKKNNVLKSMMRILDEKREAIITENKKDLEAFGEGDQAMYDRLVCDDKKVDGMINSVKEVMEQEDPVGKTIEHRKLDTGLDITNKTAPFGNIMIIYESRPDVTIEAAVLAFKANNKIYLKGGKEAINSSKILVECWHEALKENDLSSDWIELLHLSRPETQEFLKNPPVQLDLIVPRGGERLIGFVKEHATGAVLVSGRGNNFLYVSKNADFETAKKVMLNAKIDKISGCNALDKVLVDVNLPDYEAKLKELQEMFKENKVNILVDEEVKKVLSDEEEVPSESTWYEEFLAMKIVIGSIDGLDAAIEKINKYSGGHSASIITKDKDEAIQFMEQVDSAAVYHNASTRFTDGGQMGVGAELAISTDKLHHRGPLGLKQLTTNKYYVLGDGHIRA
ncbi:MAG: glutamate-5-semialdehyde dehydrogenase [Zunongwangia sp.]|uniref:Gamma-glutamyl phosphate reductase n=1 Tax=Zunongwangia profunda TaxID=398743 RepID=A0A3D5J0E7_9FLAO|nr:glutamate-5-semialdehyde dehydrogenase [Zunongwangia profunda]MAO34497.1 glutamate-5-semialdehyde dehydrogenase [Zunongwangia sp.]MAS71474.1 glutamate-5-semialdehyde dehydrogenase [Zunongwangia sp.]HCV81591.1 glutamate-5-semialdehyde dehydrogenase [Zunongwangia profunda]|tara:strand:- start:2733 stop:3932 length:1200 start_codon:yes stop_codon:yes gene_type:complete